MCYRWVRLNFKETIETIQNPWVIYLFSIDADSDNLNGGMRSLRSRGNASSICICGEEGGNDYFVLPTDSRKYLLNSWISAKHEKSKDSQSRSMAQWLTCPLCDSFACRVRIPPATESKWYLTTLTNILTNRATSVPTEVQKIALCTPESHQFARIKHNTHRARYHRY